MNLVKLQSVFAAVAFALLFAVLPFASGQAAAPAQAPAVAQLVARAQALDAQGRHDLASENWRQVLLIDPRQPEALTALAAYSQSVGDSARASQYLKQLRSVGGARPMAVAQSPSGGDARLQQASRLAASHRYADSLALYRQVFGTAPPSGPWAIAYYETEAAVPDQLPAAIAGLRSLIARYPQDPTYSLSLGKVLTYRPATRLEGARILAELHGSSAQNEQARAAWRQAILWDVTAPAAIQTASLYLQRYPDEELAARLKAGEVRPTKPEPPAESPLEGEGYKALSAGDLNLARERFSALLALPASVGKAHAGLGYVAMRQQDFPAAVDNFEQARTHGLRTPAIDKALADSRYFLALGEGNKALQTKDFDAAVIAFTRARQLDPQRPEASDALAGSLLAAGQPTAAATLFAEWVKRDPGNLDSWVEWFNALLASDEAQRVVDEQAKIPTATERRLEQRVDYLAILSSANKALGDDAAAQRMIDRIQEVVTRNSSPSDGAASAETLSSRSLLRAAGLLMQQGNAEVAAQLCRIVVQADHGNVEAWETLVRAAHAAGDDVAAMSVAERMPETAYKAALKAPEFLMTLAAIDQSRQQYEQAAKLLDRVRLTGSAEVAASPRFQLQLASLDLARSNPEHAYNTYRKVAAEYPGQLQAWSGMLAALHEGKHDREALLSVQKIPADIRLRLQADTAFLQVLASIESEAGHPRQALEDLRVVSSIYRRRGQTVPFAVDTQFAWLLLNQGDQPQLAVTLDRLGTQRGLTPVQKLELENIWAAWSMRRAEADFAAGNGRKALTILAIANQAYPENTAVRGELCSMYVRTGNPGPALKIYERMNWEAAKVGDYASAVEAALVARRVEVADKWLLDGLERYPGNNQLLSLGARLEEQRGDVRKAKEYLLAVIGNGQSGTDAASASSGLPRVDPAAQSSPEKELADILGTSPGTLLKGGKAPPARALSFDAQPSQPNAQPAIYTSTDLPAWPAKMAFFQTPSPPTPHDPEYAAGQLSRAGIRLITDPISDERPPPVARLRAASFSGSAVPALAIEAQEPVNDPTGGDPVRSFTPSTPPATSEASLAYEQKASDRLAALESRYSPYTGGGGYLDSRTGTQGFDRLQRFEVSTEASSVMGDSVRFTVITRPVLLESGIPDATSNYRFGTSLPGTGTKLAAASGTGTQLPFTDQFASGLGGELQIAAKFVQATLGYSPYSFPVTHVLASISVQPGSFPVALRAYREAVPDTLLSYAGLKDPLTGKLWGGVVATGGTLKFSRGTGLSGFYATIDGQQLTGRNVAENTRVSGGAGAYFQVYGNRYGALKVGANLTAMHYAHNQRYFTYGQGGYFSPNEFLLLNAPVTWEGTPLRNVAYTLNGSLGIQTFQDDPAINGSLIAGNGAQSITGSSYDFHARLAYRLNDHWIVSGFVDANNARDYRNAAGGFSVRYMLRPLPIEGGPTGLVEEKQVRPLAIP